MSFKKVIAVLLTILPFGSVANAALESNFSSRAENASWEEVYIKLVSNRLPPDYYVFLQLNGVNSLEEIDGMSDDLKQELVEKYSNAKRIMMASDKTRSNR